MLQTKVQFFVDNRLLDVVPHCINIPMPKDTQLNIRVNSELLEELKKLAEAEITTPSQIVRKAITLYIRQAQEDEAKRNSCVRPGV